MTPGITYTLTPGSEETAMIPAYQSFDPKKIDQMLSARLEALGIPAEGKSQ